MLQCVWIDGEKVWFWDGTIRCLFIPEIILPSPNFKLTAFFSRWSPYFIENSPQNEYPCFRCYEEPWQKLAIFTVIFLFPLPLLVVLLMYKW